MKRISYQQLAQQIFFFCCSVDERSQRAFGTRFAAVIILWWNLFILAVQFYSGNCTEMKWTHKYCEIKMQEISNRVNMPTNKMGGMATCNLDTRKYETQLHNSEIIDIESGCNSIWFENGIGLNRFTGLFVRLGKCMTNSYWLSSRYTSKHRTDAALRCVRCHLFLGSVHRKFITDNGIYWRRMQRKSYVNKTYNLVMDHGVT